MIKKLLWRIFKWHSWEYRNPYDRTCKVCGKREVAHSFGGSSWFWEVFSNGDAKKHEQSPNRKEAP